MTLEKIRTKLCITEKISSSAFACQFFAPKFEFLQIQYVNDPQIDLILCIENGMTVHVVALNCTNASAVNRIARASVRVDLPIY